MLGRSSGKVVEDLRQERLSVIGPSVFADGASPSQAPGLPQRLRDKGAIFPDDYISKDGSWIFDKDIPGCKCGQSLRNFTLEQRQNKYFKVNALRKTRSGAHSKEETCLKLNQTEGVKWVSIQLLSQKCVNEL